ncbi:MAG TPA: PilT/PilU family type 4a pilus ATPase [Pyrinomonadaceae bacterium]|jgi:twitching motility protein PilT|nr:PilT/PilU family type 4a pilus ATPase [Pyrinomonadaceae bacterium]
MNDVLSLDNIPVNSQAFTPSGYSSPSNSGLFSLDATTFHQVLHQMLAAGDKVSDLIFSPGRPPQVELTGDLQGVPIAGLEKLTAGQIKSIADVMLLGNEQGIETFEKKGSTDISYSVPGLCRFRVNIFRQRGSYAIVMRVIPTKPPNWQELDLPAAVKSVAELKNGLVLVTGPTGSGKSTTLAAVIDLINATKKYHIVTIEDPIEFIHEHKLGTVHQRELHSDTPDFALALRAALRQAPKVILVGEMRDRETIEVALEAAETGHLVLSTLHTIDAAKTIDRIIGVFPKIEEAAIRTRLAQSFRRIISQRLMPKVGGGRTAAIEILASNSRTREYIEKGEKEGRSITDAMNDGEMEGMQTFDKVLEKMIRNGTVTKEIGLAYATNSNNLALAISDMEHESPVKKEETVIVKAEEKSEMPEIDGFER